MCAAHYFLNSAVHTLIHFGTNTAKQALGRLCIKQGLDPVGVIVVMITKTTMFKLDTFTETKELVQYDFVPYKEICSLFSMMIIQLNLKKLPTLQKVGFRKHLPFTFAVDEAHDALSSMTLAPSRNNILFEIHYAIDSNQKSSILQAFFDCHFLHCPRARTLSKPRSDESMQPTAKGVAVLHSFCMRVGMPTGLMPQIIKTAFNSMRLLPLERDKNNRIICSQALLVHVLCKLVGDPPRTWRPDAAPDPILFHVEDSGDEIGGLYGLDEASACFQLSAETFKLETSKQTSPYHHPYFTNPESDAQFQYYTSSFGARFHHIDGKYVASAKTLAQWICDCTAVATKGEAHRIVDMFINANFLQVFESQPGTVAKLVGGDPLYFVTEIDLSSTKDYDSRISGLQHVISDPGYKLLFKDFLSLTFCGENLEAYVNISKLTRGVTSLMANVAPLLSQTNLNMATQTKLVSVLKSLMFRAYLIYYSHFDTDSPSQLNIPYEMRIRISRAVSVARCVLDDSCSEQTSEIVNSVMSEPIRSLSSESSSVDTKEETPLIAELIALLGKLSRISKEFMEAEEALLRLLETDSFPNFIHSTLYQRFLHQIHTRC